MFVYITSQHSAVSTDQISLLTAQILPRYQASFSGSGKLNNCVGVLIDGFKLYQIIKHNDLKMEAIFPAGHILLVTLLLPSSPHLSNEAKFNL